MIKEYIQSHKEMKTVCQKIRETSKQIQESVKANGVILDETFHSSPVEPS